jgi:transcriptional regulator with XRE-family HTH domain
MTTFRDLDLENIRARAKASGLKTRQLAEAIGVAPDTMRKFLSGATNLRKPSQILLAQILSTHGEVFKIKVS